MAKQPPGFVTQQIKGSDEITLTFDTESRALWHAEIDWRGLTLTTSVLVQIDGEPVFREWNLVDAHRVVTVRLDGRQEPPVCGVIIHSQGIKAGKSVPGIVLLDEVLAVMTDTLSQWKEYRQEWR